VDAFMCYKQKCKVVSLNLANPVDSLLQGSTVGYPSDSLAFCEVFYPWNSSLIIRTPKDTSVRENASFEPFRCTKWA